MSSQPGRIVETVTCAALGVLVAGAAAYGVLALTDMENPTLISTSAASSVTPDRARAVDAPDLVVEKPRQRAQQAQKAPQRPRPEPVLERGDQGIEVRELQSRLKQLAWYFPDVTGAYDATTLRAVHGFQGKRGFKTTGAVDKVTWQRLVSMSRMPTEAEMFNRPGPTILGPGDSGAEVRELQARLRQIAWMSGDVSDYYGASTTTAVAGFQAKRLIPSTGEVDQRTLDLLAGMTSEPTRDELLNREPAPVPVAAGAPLDPRCQTGRALCVDKSSNSLRWVIDGEVQMSVDVRFGSDELPTDEGQFAVTLMSRDHVSSLYDTAMPYAMFFSGGQAVHYSPDFAANGYSGASHGCVNVRDYAAIQSLFDQVYVGDKVIVYWS